MLALKSRGCGEIMLDMLFAAVVPMIISGVSMEWRRVHPRIFRFFTNWAMWGWKPKYRIREGESRGYPAEQGG